ncbi:MAG: malonate decarboxylase holo-[acyl-carrier-protein] synthase [Fluviibacter sp.]
MRRHDLLTLKSEAVMESVACCTSDKAEHTVKQWIAGGRAFVCPRQNPSSNTVHLGLAFVNNGVKHRAFLQARHEEVLRVDVPYRLEDCLDLFAERDASVLRDLVEKLKAAGFPLYVFGSVAWEKISGKCYRTEQSDLDLLCDVETLQDVILVTDVFAAADTELPFSIDGELRFPKDDCVNWREVMAALGHHDKRDVLVKGEAGVFMGSLDSLLGFSYA